MFRITGITVQDPGIRVHDPGIGVHDGSESVFRMVRNTQYAKPAAKSLKATFDKYRLSEISPFLIERYKRKRKDTGKSEATINRELTLLKHLFNMSIQWKFAQSNPVCEVKMFRGDNGRTRYLSREEAQRLSKRVTRNSGLLS